MGALAWLDSGFLLAGVIVLVVVGVFYGVWMARRMARYWPGAKELTGDERVTVAQAARRGERIDDARLAQPVIDYSRGLHAAAERAGPWRWLLVFVLVVAVGTAVWDAVFGSWGNACGIGHLSGGAPGRVVLVAEAAANNCWPTRTARRNWPAKSLISD